MAIALCPKEHLLFFRKDTCIFQKMQLLFFLRKDNGESQGVWAESVGYIGEKTGGTLESGAESDRFSPKLPLEGGDSSKQSHLCVFIVWCRHVVYVNRSKMKA